MLRSIKFFATSKKEEQESTIKINIDITFNATMMNANIAHSFRHWVQKYSSSGFVNVGVLKKFSHSFNHTTKNSFQFKEEGDDSI